jgi:hypothetical protein
MLDTMLSFSFSVLILVYMLLQSFHNFFPVFKEECLYLYFSVLRGMSNYACSWLGDVFEI